MCTLADAIEEETRRKSSVVPRPSFPSPGFDRTGVGLAQKWDRGMTSFEGSRLKNLGEAEVNPHAALLPFFLTGGNIWRFCRDSSA